jgi:formate-dependent nitrite reductase membrane component NrfD
MKKYLASLAPFLFCTILSFIYGTKTPKNYGDPSYPFQTKGTLAYLSTAWFYIGIIMTGVFITMFIISDAVDYLAKAIEKKRKHKLSKRD